MTQPAQKSDVAVDEARDDSKRRAREALKRAAERDPKKTQVGLAQFLGMSTSAVNKILVNELTHPMTIRFAKGLATYLESSLDDIFGEHSFFSSTNQPDSLPHNEDEAPQDVFVASHRALIRYFEGLNISVQRRRLNDLAELVANEVHRSSDLTDAGYQAAIVKVLSQKAASS